MTETQKKVVCALTGHWATNGDIARIVGITPKAVHQTLTKMIGGGVEYSIVGSPYNPYMAGLKERGSLIPKKMGFFIWRLS